MRLPVLWQFQTPKMPESDIMKLCGAHQDHTGLEGMLCGVYLVHVHVAPPGLALPQLQLLVEAGDSLKQFQHSALALLTA